MTDRAIEKRVRAVERRMGVTDNPLENISDLDLLTVIETVSGLLAEGGDQGAADTLAQHDAEEAGARAFYERPDVAGTCRLALEPGARWPYLRARARWREENHGQDQPRSAASEAELWARLTPVLDALAQGAR